MENYEEFIGKLSNHGLLLEYKGEIRDEKLFVSDEDHSNRLKILEKEIEFRMENE